ncbi:glycosyl hydrolase family 38 protein [Artemisia annua]|uniref:Glycosyl hydrolase family 38 protein n=1 Tax=Artemisia annua TaxID=35608 RepID=A0A2U1N6V9_ARTAN|nr:glycosyl hydrolase family 38 protein [Artemisia annua]
MVFTIINRVCLLIDQNQDRALGYFEEDVLASPEGLGPLRDSLGDALGISRHHDGVSSSSQQHVADDYAKWLAIGHKEAEVVVAESLAGTCPLLNLSYCPPTEANISSGKNLLVILHQVRRSDTSNDLGSEADEVTSLKE